MTLKFSLQSSVLWRFVVMWHDTNVSENLAASIFRVIWPVTQTIEATWPSKSLYSTTSLHIFKVHMNRTRFLALFHLILHENELDIDRSWLSDIKNGVGTKVLKLFCEECTWILTFRQMKNWIEPVTAMLRGEYDYYSRCISLKYFGSSTQHIVYFRSCAVGLWLCLHS
jgi:hypothetical protein